MSLAIGTNGESLIDNANGEGAPTVLLHISDLHFGWDGSASQGDDRTLCLRSLVRCLRELEASWKPTVVCVTGDIGWRGAAEDYRKAREWLLELLAELKLTPSSLLLCPGNHDSDRKLALSNVRPSQRSDAERVLQCPLAKQYLEPFSAFENFCRNLGVPPYLFGDNESYIVGFRRVSTLNFVCLNSAWFSQGDDDRGSLWLGLPQIRLMEARGQLPEANSCVGEPTIALLHHPREWYHEGEISASGNGQPNTFDYLCHRSHVILTGHTHGEVRSADQYAEFAWHLSGGAAYAGASYFNSFRLIKFESGALAYRSFEFDPRASNAPWGPKGHARSLPLGHRPGTTRSDFSAKEEELEPYQHAAMAHAERLVVTKARSITPFGTLPPPLPFAVTLHSAEVPPEFANDRRLLRDKRQEVTLTFLQAIRSSRRSLLLGDMGTGKSTLAAELVAEILHANRGILPVFIEAKAIQFEEQLTIARLLNLISAYANAQIFPTLSPISVQTLLNSRAEILIVMDGLEELPEGVPNLLLQRLYELPDHWPNVHVVATGRPVELAGVSFRDWQVIYPAQLSDQDKQALLKYEALAEGKPEVEATRTAEVLYAKLYGMPVVNAVATTPLFVRLLYSRLSQVKAGEAITIGDLLYDLAKQRAGGWAKKDQKSPIAPLFEDSFPNAIFRIEILALLALALQSRDRMAKDEAVLLLVDSFRSRGQSQEPILAEQALEFFSSAGLLLVETFVAFPSQSFLELFQGVGIAAKWRLGEQTPPLENYPWRVISFACAVLRAQGLMSAHREKVTTYLAHLLDTSAGVLPAAYVVAEALDAPCADRFLDGLKALPQHSLHIDWEAPGQSAQAIAIGLEKAAGGFEWFYGQYLDPRYPVIHRGSGIVERIFAAWAALPRTRLSESEHAMLSAIVRPHVLASGPLLHVLPILAALVPDAFTADERLWFRASLLKNDSFREIAISELIERHKSDAALVDSLLLHLARDGSPKPAALWCELNPSEQPNATIMSAYLQALARKGANPTALEEWTLKLDRGSLMAFARWAVFDERPPVAAGAAILLFESENAPFAIIGRPLLRALHDGGYFRRAEEILDRVIEQEGRTVIIALAEEIAATKNDMHGAHSGWWRLFLKHLGLAGNDAPDLLRDATGGVGCFLLARHPEIRQALRDLLASDDGHKFSAALRHQLYSINPSQKHGAAMILLVVSPESNATALEIVVQSRSRQTHGSWDEWEEYLLTLSLGPSVLHHLHARYTRLDDHSQVLALSILARNGFSLTEPEQRQLHIGLLGWRNWGLARHVSVEKTHSIQFLVEGMDEDNADVAARAATELLNRYSEHLSTQQLARAILISGGGKWRPFENQRWLERHQSDPNFQTALSEARAVVLETGREDPLFSLCCEALTNKDKWADIIWRLFLEDGRSGPAEVEEAGQWLLEQARKSDTSRAAIGSATTTFLDDPRVRQNRWTDTVQWLAVVADECSPLPKDKIREVLVRHPEPIYGSAAAALIARLGETPEAIRCRDRIGAMPNFSSLQERRHIFSDEDLTNFARSSETLHPDLCPAIEACLLRTGKTQQQLDHLAVGGATAALVAVVLSYLYGVSPQPDWIIRHISLTGKFPERRDRCRERLMECWRAGLQLANRDKAFKLSLIGRLHNALEGDDANFFFLATNIFRLRKGFTAEEAARVVTYYAAHPGYYDYGLIVIFCEWVVSSQLSADETSSIVPSLERALVTMDGWAWEPEHNKRTCIPLLLFPVSSWCLTSSSAPSELSVQVFLKGLRHLFTLRKHQHFDQHDEEEAIYAMSEVMNVVGRAPKSCLKAIALAGIKSDDAIVRAIAGFLSINLTEA